MPFTDSRLPGPAASIWPGYSRAGFTIVELLVVIGIISVLMAMAMPAMRSVRIASHQTAEMSAARQLMVAYHAYANVNRDHVLTGYTTPSGFDVYDDEGRLISGGILNIAKRRYPWRIAPFLDFHIHGLFVNQQREILEQLRYESREDYIYMVSIAPSLGLNTEWVGGDASANPPAFAPPESAIHTILDTGRYYVTRSSQVQHPGRLIVFASARAITGLEGEGNVPVEGNFRVTSPFLSELTPNDRWSPSFNKHDEPSKFGHVSPRYFRSAVTAFFDGSVDTLDIRRLRDMRHWSNWATHEEWKLPLQ